MTELWHVYPVGDLREHELKQDCWCHPDVDLDDGVVVHHALDGREHYEQGALLQ